MKRAACALLLALSAMALLAPGARADFAFLPGGEGFSAAAVNQDETPTTRAGAHPYALHAKLALTTAGGSSDGDLRDLSLSLPPGFLINPTVVSGGDQVGVVTVELGNGSSGEFALDSLTPPFGAVAALGASPFGKSLSFAVRLREADAGLDLDLEGLSKSLDVVGLDVTVWGIAPKGAYLTMPTTPCGSPLSFTSTADSWGGASARAEASAPALIDCNKSLSTAKVRLMTDHAAARTGLQFDLAVNDGGGILNPGGIARPPIKQAILRLPEGLTINPSLGAGLATCSEGQFAAESATSEEGAGCPNSAKVGEVEVQGALGLEEPLKGSLYIATPKANPFDALLGVYLVARSPSRGLIVKSIGKIEPEERSGRLTATFDQLPRLLYTHFSLTLREGQRSVLVSPPTCGNYTSDLALASWATPEAFRHEPASFAIKSGEAGGPCPAGGIQPFNPGLLAGSINSAAGAYSPFYLRMTRADSEQEITSYSATFPPGLLAKIAGLTPCPDAAIEAAKRRTGTAERDSPSCPASSSIGHTLAGYGVGGVLAYAPGGLYLAGPYHGSPLSVVAIDSALVGPFDLGVVVVRSAVRIDAARAQASIDSAGSDPIPHILAGIPLHLRDIRVYVDRPGFTVNPTSCDPSLALSRLTGAGSDLFSAADDPSATSSQRFQVLGCTALGFKPRLSLRMRGGTRRGKYPALIATYTPRAGDANLKSASVALPPSVFLAQEHLRTVCTRAQFAGGACPRDSIYGHARAVTPLMDAPLEGPVYIRSSSNLVPDLVASLSGGGVSIDLVGRVDRSRGGIRGTFEGLPDAPISKFTLALPGGKGSLLVNSEDLCLAKGTATAKLAAQSSATEVLHPKLRAKCRAKAKKKTKAAKRQTATSSEAAGNGSLRVSFESRLSPHALPRSGAAPISVAVQGKIKTADRSTPPALRELKIYVNRHGKLDTKGLPACKLDQIQPSTTRNAMAACGDALVGTGTFQAKVAIPEQSPFPSQGKVLAFNATDKGKPLILAHVYGTDPVPTSFTLPIAIEREKGTFGTVLSASLPEVGSDAAVVTGISLSLHRSFDYRGRRHSYLSAGCPAPKGFKGVLFPLAKAVFYFEGGKALRAVANRSCAVRGA